LVHDPDLVLLEFGGNNHDPRPERSHRKVDDAEFISLLEKFKSGLPGKCQVVVITFPPIIDELHIFYKLVPGGKLDDQLQSQRQIVREFAERNNYPLLDLYKLIYPNRYELVLPDGVHLSPSGHTFFAEQMAKLLRKYNLV
jgi:lysophospholipase L1-like esterase